MTGNILNFPRADTTKPDNEAGKEARPLRLVVMRGSDVLFECDDGPSDMVVFPGEMDRTEVAAIARRASEMLNGEPDAS